MTNSITILPDVDQVRIWFQKSWTVFDIKLIFQTFKMIFKIPDEKNFLQIFVLKDGSVSEAGNYKELLANGGVFAEFLMEHLKQHQVKCVEQKLAQS